MAHTSDCPPLVDRPACVVPGTREPQAAREEQETNNNGAKYPPVGKRMSKRPTPSHSRCTKPVLSLPWAQSKGEVEGSGRRESRTYGAEILICTCGADRLVPAGRDSRPERDAGVTVHRISYRGLWQHSRGDSLDRQSFPGRIGLFRGPSTRPNDWVSVGLAGPCSSVDRATAF